jgi:hypothetical protein
VLLPPLAPADLVVVPPSSEWANLVNAASAALRQWWAGAAWVNFVGIDGYYHRSSDTFSSVFGRTIAQIRRSAMLRC